MSLSNDDLYQQLLDEHRDLTSRHVLGQALQRHLRLQEVNYLIEAHERGEDILLAKLRYERPTLSRYDEFFLAAEDFFRGARKP